MAAILSWNTPFSISSEVLDVHGYTEGDMVVLDSGIIVTCIFSSDSYTLHARAVDVSSDTPVIGPDSVWYSNGNGFYGFADDPMLGAIGDLNQAVALGPYTFGVTGEADENYSSASGGTPGTGSYGHVASIYRVDPTTLVITRDFFVCGNWNTGEAVSGEATTARWGNSMVITSDSYETLSPGPGFANFKIWVINGDTGVLTIHDIPFLSSSQNPSAIAVANGIAYYWQNDAPAGPYVMKHQVLGGTAIPLASPGDPFDMNYTWQGTSSTSDLVAWTFADYVSGSTYDLYVGWSSSAGNGIYYTGLTDMGTGWTGGWYAPTRAISVQSDGLVLVSYVEQPTGIFKYLTLQDNGSSLGPVGDGQIADFADSSHYYDYFSAVTAPMPDGRAVAMFMTNNYEGGAAIWLSVGTSFSVGIIRNLVINPSGEQSFDRAWVASNGTVETNVDWEV